MWILARLRSWSATVDFVSDVAADAGPFPLALAEAAGLYTWTLNVLSIEPSAPEFLVGAAVDGIALRAAPVAGIGRALLVLVRLALLADAPAVQLGSRPATGSGLEPCLRADRASPVVLAFVEVCAVVEVTAGWLLQATGLRVPLRRLARYLWLSDWPPAAGSPGSVPPIRFQAVALPCSSAS